MTSPAMEEATETDPIADALTEHWGERCPDFHPDCHTCKAWKRYDAFVRCEPLLGEAEKALAKVQSDARAYRCEISAPALDAVDATLSLLREARQ